MMGREPLSGAAEVYVFYFVISKFVWFILQPSSLLLLTIVAGLVLASRTPWAKAGRRLAWTGLAGLAIGGLSPLSTALLVPLEQRFPVPALTAGSTLFHGIIVLGGGEDGRVSATRGQLTMNEASERIVEGGRLALRLPATRLVFSGGVAQFFQRDPAGGAPIAAFWRDIGIAADRIVTEDVSKTTYENAVMTRDLVKPATGQRWLLVTSAAHMPRSIGTFRKVGFDVTAYPVDFRTAGADDLTRVYDNTPQGLRRLDDVAREWVGLLAYWLTGRSASLYPAP